MLLAVQVEINLTAISTSLIPMLAKEVERKAPKFERESALKRRNLRKGSKGLLLPRVVEEERKRCRMRLRLNKSRNYY